MNERNGPIALALNPAHADTALPPVWREFIRFCRELGHGDIENLKIQDGVPVLAEITRKKVKFSSER